jgi:hypothetical protein
LEGKVALVCVVLALMAVMVLGVLLSQDLILLDQASHHVGRGGVD